MWILDGTWAMHDGGAGWWMLWGGIMMVLFWSGVIGLIAWGVSRLTGGRRRDEDSALDIARRRYARGEISREEFEQLKQDLEAY